MYIPGVYQDKCIFLIHARPEGTYNFFNSISTLLTWSRFISFPQKGLFGKASLAKGSKTDGPLDAPLGTGLGQPVTLRPCLTSNFAAPRFWDGIRAGSKTYEAVGWVLLFLPCREPR